MNKSTGVSFIGFLQGIFIALKLGNIINWNWIWVLAPTWGMLGLIVLIFVILFAVARMITK